jgi:glutaredoxin
MELKQASRKRPMMYGLSTCGWCAKARTWLDTNAKDSYDLVYVDLLGLTERQELMTALSNKVEHVAFPMIFFGDKCVVGYRPDEYEQLLER